MAKEAMIEINCSTYSPKIIDIIDLFTTIGWTYLNSEGKVEYLPLGDNDYNWKKSVISAENVRKLINSKEKQSETIGLILYFLNSELGICLLANNTSNILLNLNINRKTINNTRDAITDVSWYIKNILQKLEVQKCIIKNFKFEEYVD